MWYQKTGQILNTEEPMVPPSNSPQLNKQFLEKTPLVENTEVLMPPIHDKCHCYIETLIGGRKVWHASNNACNACLNARDKFNYEQSNQFGI